MPRQSTPLLIISLCWHTAHAAWSQLGSDLNGASASDEFGTSVSLNAVGDRMAVGAAQHSNGKGQVKVLQYAAGGWTQLGNSIIGTVNNGNLGECVSLSSDGARLAIGIPNQDKAQVYSYDGASTWAQLGGDLPGEAGNDDTGHSVSLSSDGSRVAVGAPGNDGGGSGAGHVRVYEYSGGAWAQLGADIDGTEASGKAGKCTSLSADGTRVLVAAPEAGGGGSDRGVVKVYGYNAGTNR